MVAGTGPSVAGAVLTSASVTRPLPISAVVWPLLLVVGLCIAGLVVGIAGGCGAGG